MTCWLVAGFPPATLTDGLGPMLPSPFVRLPRNGALLGNYFEREGKRTNERIGADKTGLPRRSAAVLTPRLY